VVMVMVPTDIQVGDMEADMFPHGPQLLPKWKKRLRSKLKTALLKPSEEANSLLRALTHKELLDGDMVVILAVMDMDSTVAFTVPSVAMVTVGLGIVAMDMVTVGLDIVAMDMVTAMVDLDIVDMVVSVMAHNMPTCSPS